MSDPLEMGAPAPARAPIVLHAAAESKGIDPPLHEWIIGRIWISFSGFREPTAYPHADLIAETIHKHETPCAPKWAA